MDAFEIIEYNPFKKIYAIEKNNYLCLIITNINLSILYEKKNSYEVEFIIDDLWILDDLLESNFKRLFSAQKNIILGEETKESNPLLLIFVDISNRSKWNKYKYLQWF